MLADYGARSYTTRSKEEQRRTAASAFVGRVRRWEKRWVMQGHLDLPLWVRTEVLAPAPQGGASTRRSGTAHEADGAALCDGDAGAGDGQMPKRLRTDGDADAEDGQRPKRVRTDGE